MWPLCFSFLVRNLLLPLPFGGIGWGSLPQLVLHLDFLQLDHTPLVWATAPHLSPFFPPQSSHSSLELFWLFPTPP